MKWLGFLAPGPDAPRLLDAGEIDRRYKRRRWVTMSTLIGTYAFFYTCRLSLGVVKKPLEELGIFTATEMGWIGLAKDWAYAGGKLINGFLADRVNVRTFLAVGLAISALLNIAMGMNQIATVAVFCGASMVGFRAWATRAAWSQ